MEMTVTSDKYIILPDHKITVSVIVVFGENIQANVMMSCKDDPIHRTKIVVEDIP